jgi:hypothetical protein
LCYQLSKASTGVLNFRDLFRLLFCLSAELSLFGVAFFGGIERQRNIPRLMKNRNFKKQTRNSFGAKKKLKLVYDDHARIESSWNVERNREHFFGKFPVKEYSYGA